MNGTQVSLIAKLQAEIETLRADMINWRYHHDEIEVACGGKLALQVRQAVMKRRERIEALNMTRLQEHTR